MRSFLGPNLLDVHKKTYKKLTKKGIWVDARDHQSKLDAQEGFRLVEHACFLSNRWPTLEGIDHSTDGRVGRAEFRGAAAELGVSRVTLWRHMKRLGLMGAASAVSAGASSPRPPGGEGSRER